MKTAIVAFLGCFIASAGFAGAEQSQFSTYFGQHPQAFEPPGNGHGHAYGHFKQRRHKHHRGWDRGDFGELPGSVGQPVAVAVNGNAPAPIPQTAPLASGAVTAVPEPGGTAGLLLVASAALFAARAARVRLPARRLIGHC